MQGYFYPEGQNDGMTDEQRRHKAVVDALHGNDFKLPQNIGEGISSLGDGLALRQQRQNAMFPSAPGGEEPAFFTALKNLVSGGNNGGLF